VGGERNCSSHREEEAEISHSVARPCISFLLSIFYLVLLGGKKNSFSLLAEFPNHARNSFLFVSSPSPPLAVAHSLPLGPRPPNTMYACMYSTTQQPYICKYVDR